MFAPEALMPAHRLAQQGYLVIAPMYRGSGGAPGHDEMGGADVHEIFNLIPVLSELGYADTGRMFLYGESRGAIMSLIAVRDGFPARAVAIYGAITDLSTFIAEGGPYRALGAQVWPGFPKNEGEIATSRSALRWPEKIAAPILIMHGGDDQDVNPTHAPNLALAPLLSCSGHDHRADASPCRGPGLSIADHAYPEGDCQPCPCQDHRRQRHIVCV